MPTWSRQLADRWASQIHAAVPNHPVSLNVQRFAIEYLITTGTTVIVSLLLGLVLGQALGVLTSLLAFALLRFFTGGKHFSSPTVCIVTTIAWANLIPVVVHYWSEITHLNTIINCLALTLCIIFAPQGGRAIVKQHQIIKVVGGLIICTNFLVDSPVIALSLLLQSCTLVDFKRGGEKKHEAI